MLNGWFIFVYSVLNIDNMSIMGLIIDYGLFGFLDYYDFGYVCNVLGVLLV